MAAAPEFAAAVASPTLPALPTFSALPVGTSVVGPSGRIGRLAGVRPGTASQDPYLLVRLRRLFGLHETTHVVPVSWALGADESADGQPAHPAHPTHPTHLTRATELRLNASRAEVAGCPRVRSDARINRDVARALHVARLTRGGATLHASVRQGVVELSGHTPGDMGMRRAIECVRSVDGVVAVHDGTAGQEPRE